MNTRIPTNRSPRRLLPIYLLSGTLLLTSLIALPTTGQGPNQAAGNGNSNAKTAHAIVGEFEGNNLTIKIQSAAKGYAGRIVKGGQSFTFTGVLKGNILNGVIDLSGKKSPFSASIAGDTLALSMGLDTFKIVRISTSPQPQPTGFAGRFSKANFTVTLSESAKPNLFTGTLVRGEKTFNLTAKKEEKTLSGMIDLGSAESPFTATLKGNALVLTMGLDSHTLPRMKGEAPRTTPRDVGPFAGMYVGKETLLSFELRPDGVWGKLEYDGKANDFSGTVVGDSFHGIIGLKKDGSRFTATVANNTIVVKFIDRTFTFKRLARNTKRTLVPLAKGINLAVYKSAMPAQTTNASALFAPLAAVSM